jgi:uncharacterized OB-fold protein
MSAVPMKSVPVRSPETAAYWAGCARNELLIQRCADCGTHQFYPRVLCTVCSGRTLEWVRASGRGRLRSYTIVRRAVSEAYAAQVPYVVALVALEEGPTMMSGIVGCMLDDVHIGMPVQVVFEEWYPGVSIPMFAPAAPAGPAATPARTTR